MGIDEVSALVAVLGIGMCRAISSGAVSEAYACRRLFGPALLTRLEALGARIELREAIHQATELEDIAALVPHRLPSAVAEVEEGLSSVLKVLDTDPSDGERWVLPVRE